jgi:hypothetical protein
MSFMENLFVFSDESGTFDRLHMPYFVYGGIVFSDRVLKKEISTEYLAAEKKVRQKREIPEAVELKARELLEQDKKQLCKVLNAEGIFKFAVLVENKKIPSALVPTKKSKQRFLSHVYRFAIRDSFQYLLKKRAVAPECVEHIYFYMDEHPMADDAVEEMRSLLEHDLKYGMYDFGCSQYAPPLFPKLKAVHLMFYNSKMIPLIRAADIIANIVLTTAYQGLDVLKQFALDEGFRFSILPQSSIPSTTSGAAEKPTALPPTSKSDLVAQASVESVSCNKVEGKPLPEESIFLIEKRLLKKVKKLLKKERKKAKKSKKKKLPSKTN